MAEKLKKIKQPIVPPSIPRYKKSDDSNATKNGRGSERVVKILEVGGLKSADYVPGVSGWILQARGGLLFGAIPSGTFPPGSISLATIQDIATAKLLGRTSSGSGPVEQLSSSAVKTLLALAASDISDFTEAAQDAIGAMLDSNTLVYTDATPLLAVKKQMSITADGSGLKLSGDAATPGNRKYYGTDSGGAKGFFDNTIENAEAASSISPVADGTYTVGNRITPVTGALGTITVKSGIITAIQQAT